jgi:hypothetical protein
MQPLTRLALLLAGGAAACAGANARPQRHPQSSETVGGAAILERQVDKTEKAAQTKCVELCATH